MGTAPLFTPIKILLHSLLRGFESLPCYAAAAAQLVVAKLCVLHISVLKPPLSFNDSDRCKHVTQYSISGWIRPETITEHRISKIPAKHTV